MFRNRLTLRPGHSLVVSNSSLQPKNRGQNRIQGPKSGRNSQHLLATYLLTLATPESKDAHRSIKDESFSRANQEPETGRPTATTFRSGKQSDAVGPRNS